jgi:hypothetical protein
MKAVLQLFWRMCLLRQSPEYVPTQTWFVATVIGANIVCSLLLSLALDAQASVLLVLTRLVVAQATTAALVWLALFLREHGNRFPATVTALFGCDLIITVCFAVLVPLTSSLGDVVSTLTFLGFMVWSLSVAGFILQRSLGVPLGIGILLAIGMMVLSVAVSEVAVGGA